MEIFGTDGVRGKANVFPMTAEMALKIGKAAGILLREKCEGKKIKVILGKDTRLSGYLIESALTAGLVSVGVKVYLVGPMPTPAIAHLTKSFAADAGIVISASHNPYEDNGIKFFDKNGWKLGDSLTRRIEKLILEEIDTSEFVGSKIGRADRIDDARGRYIEYVKSSVSNRSLEGLKVVLDCANGAAYHIAKFILKELGAEVVVLNASPNGLNINNGCGATHPEVISAAVIEHNADCGIALDGDADRIIMCDELGNVLDGDFIVAIAAKALKESGKLHMNTVVRTVMVNMGFVAAMKDIGVNVVQTAVGDKHVLSKMREGSYSVGGEQSGHIAFLEHSTTGDGMLSGLKILDIMKRSGKKLSALASVMRKFPQVIINVPIVRKVPFESISALSEELDFVRRELGETGKVLVRYSGTQMLCRVTLQGKDESEIHKFAEKISAILLEQIGEKGETRSNVAVAQQAH